MLTTVKKGPFWGLLLILLSLSAVVSVAANAQGPLAGLVDDLLRKADGYLAQDQLRTPANENAYDRYQAVLILDRNNQRALEGIRAISTRYLEMSQQLIDRGAFGSARNRLADAVVVGGDNAQTRAMAQRIERAAAKARVAAPQPKRAPAIVLPDDGIQRRFILDEPLLSQRAAPMIEQLKSLGQRVQGSREYVLIHARNDSEGRWIYQQMRQASPGYRLRGDIRRSKVPKVILEPPLD